MRRAWLVFTVFLAVPFTARADTAPPGKVPMTLVPCLPAADDLRLVSLDGAPVVCWAATCMKLVDREPVVLVAPPATAAPGPRAEVVERDGKPQVCLAADCTPLGARLAARVARERKRATAEKQPPDVAASADRKLVVIADEAWNVATDKRLKLRKPASYTSKEDVPQMGSLQLAGNLLVVSWSNCAGPCTVDQLVDDSGKNRGASFAGGGPVLPLDAQRFVVVSEYAEIHIFDLAGKRLGSLELSSEPNGAQVVILDDSTIGVLREDGDAAHRLIVVSALADGAPRVSSERFLPTCAR